MKKENSGKGEMLEKERRKGCMEKIGQGMKEKVRNERKDMGWKARAEKSKGKE